MDSQTGKNAMNIMHGKGVSPGVAMGNAFVYSDVLHRDSELYLIDREQIAEEKDRIERAISDVIKSLTIDAKHIELKLNKNAADIFLAQKAILSDPSVIAEFKRVLEEELLNAEQVVRKVFRLYAMKFREMDNPIFQDRGDDIDDLSRRILLSLSGIHAHSLENLPAGTVLVARRLLPSDTVFLSRDSTVGVLAEFAGMAAHAALIARELGIPCVGGIPQLFDKITTGDILLINGTDGTVVINPDNSTLNEFKRSLEKYQKKEDEIVKISRNKNAVTLDGKKIFVMGNVRSKEDVVLAIKRGADGIGLFRTEPFFLSAKHFPTDTEFADFLYTSLEPAKGRYINVRLLDIGADKNPIYLHLPPESDPFLGRRGIRVLREYPELLDAQLRALLKVSQEYPLGILIPMVVTEDDVTEVVKRLRFLSDEMKLSDLPRIGAMIETPAAALTISSLKKHVDFFSIGTNDLTQYTMASGRENPMVSQYFIDDHVSVMRLIELVVEESGDTPVSICGEVAGRIDSVAKILRTGVGSLSVSAALVPDIKNAIMNIRLD